MSNQANGKKLVVKSKKVIEKKQFNEVVKFEKAGDEFIGQVKLIREQETQYGMCNFLDIIELENGELKSIALSSNLESYNWAELMEKYVSITFVQYQRNKKSGRMFKEFEVAEVEVG
jgi:hypothetical protein